MLNTRSMLLFFALMEGTTVMAVQLLTAQMLAPFFGAGLQTWAAVIGITICGLALGYYLGGLLSKKYTSIHTLYWTLLIAAGWIMILPGMVKMGTYTLSHVGPLVSLIGICTLSLLPAIILLGVAPILIIQLITRHKEESGQQAGTVYTISTLGGITGTLITGFYALPAHGITITTLAIGIILGGAAMLALLANKKPLSLLFLLVLPLAWLQVPKEINPGNIKVLHHSEGLLGQVMVADITSETGVTRGLFVNRIAQTYVNPSTMEPNADYIRGITHIASSLPAGTNILVIGLAGGNLSNQLSKMGHQVTAIELDGRLPELARSYFGLSDLVNVVFDDGRHFIGSCNTLFGLIIVDAFRGEVVPGHLLTKESLHQMRSMLIPGGALVVNFNGFLEGLPGQGGRSVIRTMEASGFNTRVFTTNAKPLYRNCLYLGLPDTIGTFQPLPPPLGLSQVDPQSLNLEDALVLSDDRPLLEHLNLPATTAWRYAYNRSFISAFSTNGIPLFK